MYQKRNILLVFSFLFSGFLFAQDSLVRINTAWGEVERELLRRGDVIHNLNLEVKKVDPGDSLLFNEIRNLNISMAGTLAYIYSPDSISLSIIKKTFDSSVALVRTLTEIIKNNSLSGSGPLIAPLMAQLEGCENRLSLENTMYNEMVSGYNRWDLILRLFTVTK